MPFMWGNGSIAKTATNAVKLRSVAIFHLKTKHFLPIINTLFFEYVIISKDIAYYEKIKPPKTKNKESHVLY